MTSRRVSVVPGCRHHVGSLHDGMNLVAKEFVSARDDERGMLVLSQFVGTAQQLCAALLVNPYAVDESSI